MDLKDGHLKRLCRKEPRVAGFDLPPLYGIGRGAKSAARFQWREGAPTWQFICCRRCEVLDGSFILASPAIRSGSHSDLLPKRPQTFDQHSTSYVVGEPAFVPRHILSYARSRGYTTAIANCYPLPGRLTASGMRRV